MAQLWGAFQIFSFKRESSVPRILRRGVLGRERVHPARYRCHNAFLRTWRIGFQPVSEGRHLACLDLFQGKIQAGSTDSKTASMSVFHSVIHKSNGIGHPARICGWEVASGGRIDTLAAEPIRVAKASWAFSKFAAEVTALMPPARAEAPPPSAARIPTFSPTTLSLDIPIAASATSGLAPAIARRNEGMPAPGVTIRALMRRGWSQLALKEWRAEGKLRIYSCGWFGVAISGLFAWLFC